MAKDHCEHTNEHPDWIEQTCPYCNLEVDSYGNTERDFKYCCYPDCGCDGARLCMARNPNRASMSLNIERGSHPDFKVERAYIAMMDLVEGRKEEVKPVLKVVEEEEPKPARWISS